jgi:pSer/pThr/pTyr-binding forkhead associated (FHA) protein
VKAAKLTILSGSRAGEKLRCRETVTIGRDPDNKICIPDESVSSRHGKIEWVDGRVMLRDLGSTNGTTRNGVRIQEAELHDGDEIALGEIRIQVTLEGEKLAEAQSAGEGTKGIQGANTICPRDGAARAF